jgi:hypothetical protein
MENLKELRLRKIPFGEGRPERYTPPSEAEIKDLVIILNDPAMTWDKFISIC